MPLASEPDGSDEIPNIPAIPYLLNDPVAFQKALQRRFPRGGNRLTLFLGT